MSNFNEKIKAVLAFSSVFEGFKSEIKEKLERLDEPTDLSSLAKRSELESLRGEVEKVLKSVESDKFAFDSARRTFGEEVGVLKSFVDKNIRDIKGDIDRLDSKIEKLQNDLSEFKRNFEE